MSSAERPRFTARCRFKRGLSIAGFCAEARIASRGAGGAGRAAGRIRNRRRGRHGVHGPNARICLPQARTRLTASVTAKLGTR